MESIKRLSDGINNSKISGVYVGLDAWRSRHNKPCYFVCYEVGGEKYYSYHQYKWDANDYANAINRDARRCYRG